MKKLLILAAALTCLVSSCGTFNSEYALAGGMQAVQAMTITDEQVREYVHEYITQLDAQSTVLPESNAYSKRLAKLTAGLTEVDGVPLNFKVYKTDDVNAFACADGSVRVYTGLMDLMDDDEVLGVIGHEIGHVALKHSKKEMRAQMMAEAARYGLAATGGAIGQASASELGTIGETLVMASYSKKQECAADDFGYDFLKAAGRNPLCLAEGFEKLQSLSTGSSSSNSVNQLFSTHPDTATRIARIQERARQDGYLK